MLGSCCLVDDLDVVARANDLCNRMGLDTISTGSVIAFSMELYEKGLLTEKNSETPIKWGDGGVVLELIEKIAHKRGIGVFLGQGTKKAAKKIGKVPKLSPSSQRVWSSRPTTPGVSKVSHQDTPLLSGARVTSTATATRGNDPHHSRNWATLKRATEPKTKARES
jgi:aldehyde:ferredoxin oxidoreductase